MRASWILALFAVAPLSGPAEEPEDRLVAAELAEVSAGDVGKAAEAFKALAADEKAPEAVRSKALLGLARCQRKLGQLDAAKKSLEDLVQRPAKDPEVLRQARSYLRELQGGRAENPDFDWVREVERNPEIQARVFEWTMQLVGVPADQDPAAGRQLLALGSIALPVVERVLEASRDPVHRQHLALIALRSGRIERLAVLLDPAEPARLEHQRVRLGLNEFLDKLPDLPDEERKQVREVVAAVPRSPRTDAVRAILEIAAGDTSGLASNLRAIEDSPSLDLKARYIRTLLDREPAQLEEAHSKVIEDLITRGYHTRFLEQLEALGRFDVLGRLAGGNAGQSISHFFTYKYVEPGKLKQAPGGWGAVLRRAGKLDSFQSLHRLAEVNDEAAAEFAAFLRARDAESPRYLPYGPREDAGWTPSGRYAELMAGLLDSQDPVVLAIALEALALAQAKTGPEVVPSLERLVILAPDIHVREYAIYALLKRLETRPETAPQAASILLEAWRGRRREQSGVVYSTSSLLDQVNLHGSIQHSHPGGGGSMFTALFLGWAVGAVDQRVFRPLFTQVLAADIREEDAGVLEWLHGHIRGDVAKDLVSEGLAKLDTPGKRAALIFGVNPEAYKDSPAGREFLRAAATDPGMNPSARLRVIDLVDGAMDWLDWVKLAETGDPIVEAVSDPQLAAWLGTRPREEQDRLLDVLSRSPKALLRQSRLDIYPGDRPELPDVLLKALEDPDKSVQTTAVNWLLQVENLQGPDLYKRLLGHPVGKHDPEVYKRIGDAADPALIEPLMKLLDHPDQGVRARARATLKTIKETLEQKQEWQAILKAARERKKE